MDIKINEENFLKAHKEGCSDVKKVLETLAPELFKSKYPRMIQYQGSGQVILQVAPKTGYCLSSDRNHFLYYSQCWTEMEPYRILNDLSEIK
jgi:hypothetical protein